MRKSIKQLGLSKIANSYVDRTSQMDKLKEIANKNNYTHKVKQLTARIQEEYNFWTVKEPTQKLADVTKDLIFIKSQVHDNLSKGRIDELIEKYGLK